MASRIIVIDRTVIDQINLGHVDVARRLRDLVNENQGNNQIWITRETFNVLQTQADRRLIADLRIRMPSQDNYVERYQQRSMLDRMPHKATTTAALAFHLKAELMTLDAAFSTAYGGATGQRLIPGMTSMRPMPGAPGVTSNPARMPVPGRPGGAVVDYNQSRRLLGLPVLNIGANGRILPQAAAGPGAPPAPVAPPAAAPVTPQAPVKGATPPAATNTTKSGTTARTGPPVTAPTEYGPKSDAAFQAAQFGFQGVNYYIQELNDRVQTQRFNEAWAKLKPVIEGRLADDPALGILVFVNYSRRQKVGAENETPMEHTAVFQGITFTEGYNRSEALARFAARDQIQQRGIGETETAQFWFEPKQRVDPSKLAAPFPKVGLATFVPGRTTLMGVAFKGRAGFDDIGEVDLVVPAGTTPRFVYLKPPDEIKWYWNGQLQSTDINTDKEHAAQAVGPDNKYSPITVVKLDSWANPHDTTATMIFPADRATELLFKKTKPTRDNYNQLSGYRNMEMVRWIEPENMRLLEEFK